MVAAIEVYGILFTLDTMIPWFSLHVVAPLLLIHHSFFMRWPLPPGGPPMGPHDTGRVMNFDDDDDDDNVKASGEGEEVKDLLPRHEETEIVVEGSKTLDEFSA